MSARWGSVGTRWLGVGLAAALAVLTLGLALTDRLALYINPDQTWFAVGMAVLALAGAVASFLLPLGAEGDHGHEHGHDQGRDHGHEPMGTLDAVSTRFARSTTAGSARSTTGGSARAAIGRTATVTGGVLASAVTIAALVLPPASLSVELAMARDTGTAPLFAGADDVLLAAADTSEFGVGDWARVFSSATSPDSYEGTHVTLTGFVTPDDRDADTLRLGRLVITHCVIDAQPASLPVESPDWQDMVEVGGWIEVDGIVTTDASGALVIEPRDISAIPEPADPYEY